MMRLKKEFHEDGNKISLFLARVLLLRRSVYSDPLMVRHRD